MAKEFGQTCSNSSKLDLVSLTGIQTDSSSRMTPCFQRLPSFCAMSVLSRKW